MGDQNNQWSNSEDYSLSKRHYKKRCSYTILCIASVGLPAAKRKMQARQNLLTFRTLGILYYWSAFYIRTRYNK